MKKIFLLAVLLAANTGGINDWWNWPQKNGIPIATDDCMTDSCLEYREQVLAEIYGFELAADEAEERQE